MNDLWNVLLGFGMLATFGTVVCMVLGLTPGKRAAPPPEPMSSLRIATANAARERAAASARAKAAAAAKARAHELTDVREVVEVRNVIDVTATPIGRDPRDVLDLGGARPAGQPTPRVDGRRAQEHAATGQQAEAIIAHYAETDPSRLAEVIIQWIKSDANNEAPRQR